MNGFARLQAVPVDFHRPGVTGDRVAAAIAAALRHADTLGAVFQFRQRSRISRRGAGRAADPRRRLPVIDQDRRIGFRLAFGLGGLLALIGRGAGLLRHSGRPRVGLLRRRRLRQQQRRDRNEQVPCAPHPMSPPLTCDPRRPADDGGPACGDDQDRNLHARCDRRNACRAQSASSCGTVVEPIADTRLRQRFLEARG